MAGAKSIMEGIANLFGGPKVDANQDIPQGAPQAKQCVNCGKDPYQAAGEAVANVAKGDAGKAFMANNPFK